MSESVFLDASMGQWMEVSVRCSDQINKLVSVRSE